jgi:hypothetical protein
MYTKAFLYTPGLGTRDSLLLKKKSLSVLVKSLNVLVVPLYVCFCGSGRSMY